jgi:hypothetical protein
VTLFVAICIATPASAQILRGRRIPLPEPEAITGTPFGVGRVSIQLPEARPRFFGEREFTLAEANGRVFYAAFDFQPVRAILREILNRPQNVTVHFLFVGNEPLELELFAPSAVRMRVIPGRDPAGHKRLLAAWWDQYTRAAERAARTDEYPQLVDQYLVSMLAARLQLEPPRIDRRSFKQPDVEQSLGVLLGTESMRLRMQEEVMLSSAREGEATEALPRPIEFAPAESPGAPEAKLEPIAAHVPEECFYVRFGSFPNYLWFNRLLTEFGGDLRNLIALRGLDYQLNVRQEQQLALKETGLAELLGPQVIADVALVGQDMFLREGAAIGILFQARSSFALTTDIRSQRAAALQANKDAKETTIDVAGNKVSFLSTPHNRIRSFYAVDGEFHFVTTSRTLVRRFYEAGAGKQALAQSAEFRLARAQVPLERDDTVFAYLPSAFFHNMLGPQYRIEMTRRLRSVAEIDLAKMALLAAKNEGHRNPTIDDLIRGGLLPVGFGHRPDGTQLVLGDDGEILDSLRGRSGSFTPVPDVAFDAATLAEVRDYEQSVRALPGRWQRIDPIVVAAKRFAGEIPQIERVAIDARMTPLAAKNYELLMKFAGPPSRDRMAPVAGNVVTLEAVGKSRGPEPAHLYAGVRDTSAAFNFADDQLGSLGALLNLKFYFGGWPSAGIFSLLGLRDDLPVDGNGFSRPSGWLWQRTDGPFVTGSSDPDVLADVTPRFRVAEAERPSQLWLQLGDLRRSELAKLINGFGYFRARQVTGGNLHFMHKLSSQLGVPPERAKQAAEDLVGAQLVCALDGQYKLDQPRGGLPTWLSTAWDPDASRLITQVPAGFTSPPLDWLRGLELDAALTPRELSAHALLVIERRAPPATAARAPEAEPVLPAFPFKGLDWFGGRKDAKADAEAKDGKTTDPQKTDRQKEPLKDKPEELPEPKREPTKALGDPAGNRGS